MLNGMEHNRIELKVSSGDQAQSPEISGQNWKIAWTCMFLAQQCSHNLLWLGPCYGSAS